MIHALEFGFGAFGGLLAFSLFWEMLKGATPIITAAVVVYIAWQQWRLARQRVKLDLFQKRLPLYHAAQALAAFVAANGKVTEDELHKFISRRATPPLFSKGGSLSTFRKCKPKRSSCGL